MKLPSKSILPMCPKRQSADTTKNGTAPGKLGRIQRLRCNNCKHIWNDAALKINPHRLAQTFPQQSKSKPTTELLNKHSSHRSDPILAKTATFTPQIVKTTALHHRKLELDIPLDWSPTGLLNFSRAAQQNLLQAAKLFGHPGVAELEWEALSPALKSYLRARQHLDFALILRLQSEFTTSESSDLFQPSELITERQSQTIAPSLKTPRQKMEKPKKQKHRLKAKFEIPAKSVKRKPNLPGLSGQPTPKLETETGSTAGEPPSRSSASDEPDRTHWLEEFAAFHAERQAWTQERVRLQKSVRDLEQTQSQNTLRLTSVTHEFERLKKQVLEAKPSLANRTEKETTGTPNGEVARGSNSQKITVPIPSSSKRTVPPKYTAREAANLERLASSLMANLVRLEGFRVRPRDLPHITGERAAWKTVIEHLLTLGKIERRGDFIAVSLVERLRRGLPSTGVESRKPL
jgi:hypothetical protein